MNITDIIPADMLTAEILTWNEEENIARTLSRLGWLEKIIIIDSGSTDKTIELVQSFPNTEIHTRKFDTHATQWNYGLNFCNSKWVLSLDADYILPDAFIEEVQQNILKTGMEAFYANFDFVVMGKALRGNNTTPRAVLFKKEYCSYYDDGHTQRLLINGRAESFTNKILHDDRKPLTRWLYNQGQYSQKEVIMLLQRSDKELPFTGKLRKKKILAPVFIFFYCLLYKKMMFNGWRGWHYTLQRTLAEILISLRLTEAAYLNKEEKDVNK
jgi:glycosyltransferase involved in cell wall biosynthesis